jgi:hypothetical protein
MVVEARGGAYTSAIDPAVRPTCIHSRRCQMLATNVAKPDTRRRLVGDKHRISHVGSHHQARDNKVLVSGKHRITRNGYRRPADTTM